MYESEAMRHLVDAERMVHHLIARRRGRNEWRARFGSAFIEARAALRKSTLSDDETGNIAMGVSCEAAGRFVRSAKEIDLAELEADLRFVPAALRMRLRLPPPEESPRALRAARQAWEALGCPEAEDVPPPGFQDAFEAKLERTSTA